MFIELERAQHALLIELIEARIRELITAPGDTDPTEWDASRVSQLEALQRLLHQFHEAEWEVTC
jgi:hypothetical protein